MIGVIESRFPALLKGDDGVGAEVELNEVRTSGGTQRTMKLFLDGIA